MVLPTFSEYEGSTKRRAAAEQLLLLESDNGTGDDANSVSDPQLCCELCKLGAETLVVGADNGQYSGWGSNFRARDISLEAILRRYEGPDD